MAGPTYLPPSAAGVGVESFVRVLSPLTVVLLLAIAQYALAKWQPVHLLGVALPLFGSLVIIRSGFYLLRRVFARHGQSGVVMLAFEKIFALLVWLAVALYITGYTVLQGFDGVESVVPNEMLVSGAVQNYSLSNKIVRVATHVSVAYDSDLDLVLALLEAAASGIARVSATPPPTAMLQRFGADGLELELGFWISDPENGRGGVSSDVNRAIWRALQAHQISVPYPQREVRMLGAVAESRSPARDDA